MAAAQKVSPRLTQAIAEGQKDIPVIIFMAEQLVVQTDPTAPKATKGHRVYHALAQFAARTQAPIRQVLADRGLEYRPYLLANAIALHATPADIDLLAQRHDVGRLLYDGAIMLDPPVPSPAPAQDLDLAESRSVDVTWGIAQIQADSVWALGYKGQGVTIAGQDTGYKWDLSQIKDKYRGYDGSTVDHNYNWHDAIHDYSPLHADSTNPCGLNVVVPCDDNNHGTHTMGTMVGEDSTALIGVAPEAQWIGCRNMDRGYGSQSTYTECFEWFLAPTDLEGRNPDPSKAPHVIANSWGCPPMEGCNLDNFGLIEVAVNNLRAAGIVVVVSAGNDGPACHSLSNPAAIFEGSFTVGASNQVDTIAGFSSRGYVAVDSSYRPKPNVVAPGTRILSVVRDGSLARWNGTSMAGPHVAGAVALMISAVPELAGRVDLIEDLLEETALVRHDTLICSPSQMNWPDPSYGYGRIDVYAAVKAAQEMFPTSVVEPEWQSAIAVSPNPASDRVVVRSPRATVQQVAVYDLMSHEVLRRSASSFSVGGLAPATYILRIATDQGEAVRRLIVQ